MAKQLSLGCLVGRRRMLKMVCHILSLTFFSSPWFQPSAAASNTVLWGRWRVEIDQKGLKTRQKLSILVIEPNDMVGPEGFEPSILRVREPVSCLQSKCDLSH